MIGFVDFRESCALQVEHDAGSGELHALETRVVGQVGQRPVIEFDDGRQIDG